VLGELTRRFTEADVAMMLTLLNAVGLQLRADDPAAMKVGGVGGRSELGAEQQQGAAGTSCHRAAAGCIVQGAGAASWCVLAAGAGGGGIKGL
jgi:hypothetical protein